MNQTGIRINLVVVMIGLFSFASFGSADAIRTASENFCSQFPTHSECTGWRVKPIHDNFWFCEYVDIPTMCKDLPDPEKQIEPLDSDYCCRLFDDKKLSPLDLSDIYYDRLHSQAVKQGLTLPATYPVKELTVWTDKDHYDFGDRINVYGKFDFGDPILAKSNPFVDVKLNGQKVMNNIAVHDNGWFSGFFFLDDPRLQTTGLSQITVSYIHKPTKNDPGKEATSTYQFTTGNIHPPDKSFSINLPATKFSGNDTIRYSVIPQDPVPLNLRHTVISRITNPDGIVFSLPPTSVEDLDKYIKDVSDLLTGNYTIKVNMGNITTTAQFEYSR